MLFGQILFLISTYLICAVPFGLIVAKIFTKKDVREYGSKNIGATNVTRVAGLLPGIITFILDSTKGALMVAIGILIFKDYSHLNAFMSLVALVAVAAHCYSVYLNFNGGKGVATSLAVISVINPLVGFFTASIWLLSYSIYKISSIASLTASFLAVAFGFYNQCPIEQVFLYMALFTIIIVRHKENIERLVKCEEKQIKL